MRLSTKDQEAIANVYRESCECSHSEPNRFRSERQFRVYDAIMSSFEDIKRAIEEENESTALMICDHLKDYIPQYFNS
jgi:hypothetical protein